MQVERKIQAWIKYVLATYAAHPVMLEQITQSEDDTGVPSLVEPTGIQDLNRLWIPGEWTGGVVRYGGQAFPITGNTPTFLAVTGDPTGVMDTALAYKIIPGDVLRLQTYLTTRAQTVEVSYARLPTVVPVIHLRLESDAQAEAYIGESVERTFDPVLGEETTHFDTEMQATYLLSILSENPQETLWLYTLLLNATLQGAQRFALWGLSNLSVRGSDIHPDLEYIPDQVYGRFLTLTCRRLMHAVSLWPVEQVTEVVTVPTPRYQDLDSGGDPPPPRF